MSISKVVRRTHMYLALFLFPWVLMYALSTLVMNHRAVFVSAYGEGRYRLLRNEDSSTTVSFLRTPRSGPSRSRF